MGEHNHSRSSLSSCREAELHRLREADKQEFQRQVEKLVEQHAIIRAELETRISDLIAAERRSSDRALRLEEQLQSERSARGMSRNADTTAECQRRCEERLVQLSEEHQAQIHRYEAQVSELTAAEQRAICLNEQRDAAEKRNEEHVAW